jgi:uncharacterized membrane protein YhaH (DUF805 family)
MCSAKKVGLIYIGISVIILTGLIAYLGLGVFTITMSITLLLVGIDLMGTMASSNFLRRGINIFFSLFWIAAAIAFIFVVCRRLSDIGQNLDNVGYTVMLICFALLKIKNTKKYWNSSRYSLKHNLSNNSI